MKSRILVIDDDPLLLGAVQETLRRDGHEVETASDWRAAEAAVAQSTFDLFLLDYKMPEVDGLELMQRLRRHRPEAEAVIVTGYATIERGVEAIRLGARDFIVKPIESFELLHRVNTILERRHLRQALAEKEVELRDQYAFENIIGVSAAVQGVRDLGRRAAQVQGNVLIDGESGTGKELLARAIHQASPRREGPFVPVNCGAIPPSLAESEFFGHEKGAFTGAVSGTGGYFQAAEGGTLFLDEIGDLPLQLQTKLLRAIDNREVVPVGASEPVGVDVRLIFATNRDLTRMVEKGEFREDLYYRVNVLHITIPPLRERREDIPVLATSLLRAACKHLGVDPKPIDEDAMLALEEHDWPGNVRALINALEHALTMGESEVLELGDLPRSILTGQLEAGANEAGAAGSEDEPICITPTITRDFMRARHQVLELFDREFLTRHIRRNDGNISQTAKEIGLARTALQRFLRKYDLKREDLTQADG